MLFCVTDSRYCRRGILPGLEALVELLDSPAGIDTDRPIRVGLVHALAGSAEAVAAVAPPTGFTTPGQLVFYHLDEADYNAGVLAPKCELFLIMVATASIF